MKIIGFSGERKDWDRWSITFLAKARLRGYRYLLLGIEELPLKGAKGFEEFMEKNDFTFAELLISSECDPCLVLVNTSRSDLMPEGDARFEFASEMKYNLSKTKKEFIESRLEDASIDPDIWIQSLEILRQRLAILGQAVSEMDLIIHIINNLPEEYENTVEFIQNELEGNAVSLEKVKERLRMKYERLCSLNIKSEKAFISMGKFKGNCTFCGIYGHKAKDCKKRASLKRRTE